MPVYGKDVDSFAGFEYLFWVGCAGAYEDRAKKTTKAVAELLAAAGVKFLVLGDGETCTGDSARRSGNEFLFQQLAAQNVETLNRVFEGVERVDRKVVATCPHCFNTLGREYPQVGGSYTVLHHTQLLNRLVRDKKLVPVSPMDGGNPITYHDPCYLGRHNKVYEAPRELIGASGAALTEMPRHADRGFCCGAGGARMWMEEHIGKRVNHERVDEALATDASKIATGCPFCRVMITDGVGDRGRGDDVEVIDVAQLLLGALDQSTVTLPAKGAAAMAAAAAAPATAAAAAPRQNRRPPSPRLRQLPRLRRRRRPGQGLGIAGGGPSARREEGGTGRGRSSAGTGRGGGSGRAGEGPGHRQRRQAPGCEEDRGGSGSTAETPKAEAATVSQPANIDSDQAETVEPAPPPVKGLGIAAGARRRVPEGPGSSGTGGGR